MLILLPLLQFILIIVSFLFHILLAKTFGISSSTDIYFLSISIIIFISGLSGFITDTYIPSYNALRIEDGEGAKELSGSILVIMFITSFLATAAIYFLAPILVKIFASGYSPQQISLTVQFLRIILFSLTFSTLLSVIQDTLNAHSYFIIYFIVTILSKIIVIFGVIIAGRYNNILLVAYAYTISSIISFIILSFHLHRKIGIAFKNPFRNPHLLKLIKQNFPLRMGFFIYLIKQPIITNILSHLAPGTITLYNYTDRVAITAHDLSSGSTAIPFYAKISSYIAQKKTSKIKSLLDNISRSNSIIFTIITIFAVALFKPTFLRFFTNKISPLEINQMYYLFLGIIPYYFLAVLETPLLYFLYAIKQGKLVLLYASIYIIIFATTTFLARSIGIYSIPLGFLAAYSFTFVAYFRAVFLRLNKVESNIKSSSVQLLTIVACVIINLSKINFRTALLWETLVMGLFLFYFKEEISKTIKFVTSKGIIH